MPNIEHRNPEELLSLLPGVNPIFHEYARSEAVVGVGLALQERLELLESVFLVDVELDGGGLQLVQLVVPVGAPLQQDLVLPHLVDHLLHVFRAQLALLDLHLLGDQRLFVLGHEHGHLVHPGLKQLLVLSHQIQSPLLRYYAETTVVQLSRQFVLPHHTRVVSSN